MKKNFHRSVLLLGVLCAMFMTIGCTREVPQGHRGMIMKPSGLTDEVLAPGRHVCFNRAVMLLVETKEETITESMKILCADDLNFGFDLKVRTRLQPVKSGKGLRDILERKGADMVLIDVGGGKAKVLKFEKLYNTYVKPVARSVARGAVSKFATTQVRNNRDAIEKTVFAKLIEATEGTPLEIVTVTTSNFDYPDVITTAVENKRKKEIEIEEEKARQAMVLLQAENRLKLAQKMKIVRATEAQAEAAYIRVMGGALTKNFLALKSIERDRALYERVEAGDKVIVSGSGNSVIPMVNTGGK